MIDELVVPSSRSCCLVDLLLIRPKHRRQGAAGRLARRLIGEVLRSFQSHDFQSVFAIGLRLFTGVIFRFRLKQQIFDRSRVDEILRESKSRRKQILFLGLTSGRTFFALSVFAEVYASL